MWKQGGCKGLFARVLSDMQASMAETQGMQWLLGESLKRNVGQDGGDKVETRWMQVVFCASPPRNAESAKWAPAGNKVETRWMQVVSCASPTRNADSAKWAPAGNKVETRWMQVVF